MAREMPEQILKKLQDLEGKLDTLLAQSESPAESSKKVSQLREQIARSLVDTGDVPVTPFPGFPRPLGATGDFLRIVMVNDVYKLANYPPLAQLLRTLKATQAQQGCKMISVLNGDFLSPCIETSLDGGRAMCEVLNKVPIDYVCFGNHEFDVGLDLVKQRIREYKGTWLNGNIPSPKFLGPDGNELPKYATLAVGSRKVCLTGVTTDNMDIYRPGIGVQITPPVEAVAAVAAQAAEEEGGFDVLLPLTHQLVGQDRAMAEELLKRAPSLEGKVPVICGGHEHDIYIEDSAGSLIVKVGADAVNAGVIDVWWGADGKVQRSVQMLPLASFQAPESCPCQAFVQKQRGMLSAMMSAEIMRLPVAMATDRTRFEPSALASQLMLMVKKALSGVELVVIQGGAVRGGSKYEPGPFTFKDLMKELPFATEQAIIQLPGRIIAESIKNTRSTPDQEAPNYLHVDSECAFNPEDASELTHIDGKPLDPERVYKVSVLFFLLCGLNSIEPLVSYVKEHVKLPDLECCLPAKELIMESCMKAAWRRIIKGFPDLKSAMTALDKDGSGRLNRNEIADWLKVLEQDRDPANDVSVDLIGQLIKCLDEDGDDKISLQELQKLAQV